MNEHIEMGKFFLGMKNNMAFIKGKALDQFLSDDIIDLTTRDLFVEIISSLKSPNHPVEVYLWENDLRRSRIAYGKAFSAFIEIISEPDRPPIEVRVTVPWSASGSIIKSIRNNICDLLHAMTYDRMLESSYNPWRSTGHDTLSFTFNRYKGIRYDMNSDAKILIDRNAKPDQVTNVLRKIINHCRQITR